jgi:hypothetical protein
MKYCKIAVMVAYMNKMIPLTSKVWPRLRIGNEFVSKPHRI